MKGGVEACKYDSDTDIKFRQESNFYYMTGCQQSDCCALFDGVTKLYTLFVPRLGAEHELWMGKIPSFDEQFQMYKPDQLMYTEELPKQLSALGHRKCHVILNIPEIPNQNMQNLEIVNDLQPMIAELRIIKDAAEIQDLKKSCEINTNAFHHVMSNVKAGMREYQAEALHQYSFLNQGARFVSFNAITASGANGSTLHFVNNVNVIGENQTFILDAGCEYNLACSDHTRTFPTGKKFTQKQEDIYNIVLKANKKGIEMAKPGVKWEDVHLACLEVILIGLRELGIVNNSGTVEEQMLLGIPSIF